MTERGTGGETLLAQADVADWSGAGDGHRPAAVLIAGLTVGLTVGLTLLVALVPDLSFMDWSFMNRPGGWSRATSASLWPAKKTRQAGRVFVRRKESGRRFEGA